MLILKNINKKYKKKVIDNFSFIFNKGNIYGIIGPSGCGKSTLLSIISGVTKKYSGKIYYNGINIKQLKNYTFNNISFVSQSYQLIDNLTAYENVILPLLISNKKINDIKVKVLFKEFNVYETLNLKVKNLSGGEKQRIAIIRAILKDSDILLLDEPTSALDEKTSNLLFDYLLKIKEKKIIIMITHDLSLARKCDVIIKHNDKYEINKVSFYKKNIIENKIKFTKTKLLYNKVFKNNRLFNYLTTYVLSIGLIGISLSFTLNSFINNVVDQSLNILSKDNCVTIKSKNDDKIIDFTKLEYENKKVIYYEGIPSNIKQSIKEANLIDYVDLNYYDIINVNFIFDNYISEYDENIVLAIPSYLGFINSNENYLNIYYQDNSLSLKINKLVASDDDNFYLYCNNTSYLNPIYKHYNISFKTTNYLYHKNTKKLYNYLLNDETYNNYLFYLNKENNLILIEKAPIKRINFNQIKIISSNYNYIVSDNINTFIDYDNGFSFIIYQSELIQVIIDENIENSKFNITSKLSNNITNQVNINNVIISLNDIINENNYSFIYMNSYTYNSLSTDLIYTAIIFNNDISPTNQLLVNNHLFQTNSFNVFSYISDFITLFSIMLIIEAVISSLYVFTINFIKKKKDIVCLLNLGIYKNNIIKLLLYDPINNIISAIISSLFSYIFSSIIMIYLYNIISNSSLELTISISVILLLIFIPFFIILPLILIKIYNFFKKQNEK